MHKLFNKEHAGLLIGMAFIMTFGFCMAMDPQAQQDARNLDAAVSLPIAKASNPNVFNLSRRVTTKQFSVRDGKSIAHKISNGKSMVRLQSNTTQQNKKLSKKVDNYLNRVNNLNSYDRYFTRTTEAHNGYITENITFIRK